MFIVVIWLSSYSSFFFRFTFQCFSSVCFLLFFNFFGLLPITKKTMILSKNEKLGRRKLGWIQNFDSLHTWVITDSICSAVRSMISWLVKNFLSLFITFRTSVKMSIIPPHVCFCFALHLEWSLNRCIDKK